VVVVGTTTTTPRATLVERVSQDHDRGPAPGLLKLVWLTKSTSARILVELDRLTIKHNLGASGVGSFAWTVIGCSLDQGQGPTPSNTRNQPHET
jgi:hypothetical protein